MSFFSPLALHRVVSALISTYILENNPERAPHFADMLHHIKSDFLEVISTFPDLQANLFDQVMARALLEQVADTFGDGKLPMLLELTCVLLYTPSMPNPFGTLSLEALLDEVIVTLASSRTRLVEWALIRELLPIPEQTEDLITFEAIGKLLGALFTEARAAGVPQEDLEMVGRLGLKIVGDIVHSDLHGIGSPHFRRSSSQVVIVWVMVAGDFFLEELQGLLDQQQLRDLRRSFQLFVDQGVFIEHRSSFCLQVASTSRRP
ncbi:hypothetical protein Daus18300_010811 [Diaporthe australafricana]|uniref:Uncharacterized protein n=1 Tax=Diaporthe australafricana TaxID=127596 RepID=A0ABR3W923_9PEZI